MAASSFMGGGSTKTLTHTLLTNLFKGNASISLLPYSDATGVASFSSLDFGGADEIYTIKDSFSIAQGDPTTSEIKIDQKDETIDTSVEKGEWTISGNIPTIASAILDVFFDKGQSSITGVKGQSSDTYVGAAYFASPKEVYATMMVEAESKRSAIIFAKVKMTVGVALDDNSNPAYLKLSASILANDEATGLIGDWASLVKSV